MRYFICVLCLTFICAVGESAGQETAQSDRRHAVVIPPEIIMPVVASQPDCPLQFENVKLLKYLDGSGGEMYQLRNRSLKPIRSYKIAMWISVGTGDETSWPRELTSELLMPDQTTPRASEGREIKIVRLTDELRDKLKLRGSMQGIIVFMVVSVEFADGTTYNDEITSKALEAYTERIGASLDYKR